MHCHISNLECITTAENVRRNYNREKQQQTLKLLRQEGFTTGAVELSDSYVAGLLAEGNKELKAMILKDHYDLVEIKRAQLLLNRHIKNYEKPGREVI